MEDRLLTYANAFPFSRGNLLNLSSGICPTSIETAFETAAIIDFLKNIQDLGFDADNNLIKS